MSEKTPSPILEAPPDSNQLTEYDRAHLVTYLQLLDADAAGADWQATAKLVLSLDPVTNLKTAKRTYDAHLARAYWMTSVGYRQLLNR